MVQKTATPPAYDSNADILRAVEGKSCHGDLVSPVLKYFAADDEVFAYCPDWRNFAFMLFSRRNIVFAACCGMKEIALRIPQPPQPFDLAPFPEVGPYWWGMPTHHSDFKILLALARNQATTNTADDA